MKQKKTANADCFVPRNETARFLQGISIKLWYYCGERHGAYPLNPPKGGLEKPLQPDIMRGERKVCYRSFLETLTLEHYNVVIVPL